jgi:hypothetical protein
MKEASNHKISTATDIHKYLAGKLSAAEMHAMEKAAHTDPFLAEALEGFAASPYMKDSVAFAGLQSQLGQLKNKISGGGKHILHIHWLKAAAATTMIVGSGIAIHLLSTPTATKQPQPVAKLAKSIQPAAKQLTAPLITVVQPVIKKQVVVKPAISGTRHIEAPVLTANIPLAANNPGLTYTANTSDSSILSNSAVPLTYPGYSAAINSAADNNFIAANSLRDKPKKTAFAYKKRAVENTYSGFVTDSNKAPIPYASIFADHHITQTDENGRFDLPATDSSAEIVIGASGYHTKVVAFEAGDAQTIVLSKASEQKDKDTVVLGDGRLRSLVDILYKSGAEPKDGWANYLQYLIDRLSYSEYDDGRKVNGQMILNFRIDINEMPTDFQFERSIDEDVDNAIKHLIINGPLWKQTKGLATPGTIRMRIIF